MGGRVCVGACTKQQGQQEGGWPVKIEITAEEIKARILKHPDSCWGELSACIHREMYQLQSLVFEVKQELVESETICFLRFRDWPSEENYVLSGNVNADMVRRFAG